mmetsp:Transcript_7542/g.15650  ORF Transcript_7542/g.15650 Transcript_7542/m.15650 type:complete len:134 (-) Transcript_7542:117-518(-)
MGECDVTGIFRSLPVPQITEKGKKRRIRQHLRGSEVVEVGRGGQALDELELECESVRREGLSPRRHGRRFVVSDSSACRRSFGRCGTTSGSRCWIFHFRTSSLLSILDMWQNVKSGVCGNQMKPERRRCDFYY